MRLGRRRGDDRWVQVGVTLELEKLTALTKHAGGNSGDTGRGPAGWSERHAGPVNLRFADSHRIASFL